MRKLKGKKTLKLQKTKVIQNSNEFSRVVGPGTREIHVGTVGNTCRVDRMVARSEPRGRRVSEFVVRKGEEIYIRNSGS